MRIETKFNIGDTIYYKTCQNIVLKCVIMEIEISIEHEPDISYLLKEGDSDEDTFYVDECVLRSTRDEAENR